MKGNTHNSQDAKYKDRTSSTSTWLSFHELVKEQRCSTQSIYMFSKCCISIYSLPDFSEATNSICNDQNIAICNYHYYGSAMVSAVQKMEIYHA